MKVFIQGHQKSEISLTDRDFITEGGEGKIYGRGDVIFKIYFDKKKVIHADKILELNEINKDNILCPKAQLLNENKVPVGFIMKWVKDTVPICKMFTNEFRKRMNVSPDAVVELVDNMAKDIQHIHSKKCLIVDGSEMNFLVDSQKFNLPYFIDVDSYQTPHFPATAITPSIQDFHSKGFSELTDWFSFAVVAIQLFVGIHPYKGSHPNYKKIELEKRMRNNVSIFNSKVGLPASVRDFSFIPANYKDWFYNVFEKGARTLPPVVVGKVAVVVKIDTIKSTNIFNIELVSEYDEDIIRYVNGIVFTKSKMHIGRTEISSTPDVEVMSVAGSTQNVFVNIENRKLRLQTSKGGLLGNYIRATDKVFINGMLFVVSNDLLLEVQVDEINGKLFPIIKSQWNILPNAAKLFNGIVYQNTLGVPYLMIPYKLESGKTACFIKPIDELKGYRILEAKHESGVAMIIGYKNNVYDRFILKFDDEYKNYDCRIDSDVSFHVPNFVVLGSGIVVCITDDDAVEIFNKRLDKSDVKRIEDDAINFDMKLYTQGGGVVFAKGKKLFKLSMKMGGTN